MVGKTQGEALAREAELLRKLGLQLAELQGMGLGELRAKHVELFGEEAKSKNLPFLRKRLAFRLQERVHGGLNPEARTKIEELAPQNLPTVKKSPRRASKQAPVEDPQAKQDPRLPPPGTMIRREHRGVVHEVEVKGQAFYYRGKGYRSLSAIAKEISGTAWNGFAFFGLKEAGRGK